MRAGMEDGALHAWDLLSGGTHANGLGGAGRDQLKIAPLTIPGGPSQPLTIPGGSGSGGGTPASALQLSAPGTQSHSSAVAFSPGLGNSSAVGSYQSGAGSFTGGSPSCGVAGPPPVSLFQARSSPSKPVAMPPASSAMSLQNGFHPARPTAAASPAGGSSGNVAAAGLRASSLPGMHSAMYRALAGSSPSASQQALPPRPPFRPSPSLPISRLSAGCLPATNGGGSSVDRSPSSGGPGSIGPGSNGPGSSPAGPRGTGGLLPNGHGLSIAPLAIRTPFGRGQPMNGSNGGGGGLSNSMRALGRGTPPAQDASGSSAASTLTGILVGSLGNGQPRCGFPHLPKRFGYVYVDSCSVT